MEKMIKVACKNHDIQMRTGLKHISLNLFYSVIMVLFPEIEDSSRIENTIRYFFQPNFLLRKFISQIAAFMERGSILCDFGTEHFFSLPNIIFNELFIRFLQSSIPN